MMPRMFHTAGTSLIGRRFFELLLVHRFYALHFVNIAKTIELIEAVVDFLKIQNVILARNLTKTAKIEVILKLWRHFFSQIFRKI